MEVDVVAKRAEIAHPAFWRLRSTIASWVCVSDAVRPGLLLQRLEDGGSNMPVALPEPDGEREGIPLWQCPNCDKFKPLEDYGWRMRKDICPGQQVWFKQGWCNRCLEAKIKDGESA